MNNFTKKCTKHLHISKKSSNFVLDFVKNMYKQKNLQIKNIKL